MKRFALSAHMHRHCSESFICNTTILNEEQIIDLHQALLTNGFHHMYANTIQEGRSILHVLLQSLGCHQDIACLTVENKNLPATTFDLYYYLFEGGYLDAKHQTDLEDFFLNRFENDFLWIEATPQLTQQPWFFYFEQKLIELRINQQVPIMIISYNKKGRL